MATLCRNCGGSLIFSPGKQRVTCSLCGASYRPEEVSAADKENLQNVTPKTQAELFGSRDKASYECRIYTCSHCGGNVIINGTEASTMCVYCGNPTVVFNRVAREMRPDGILPFSISKDEAKMLIRTRLSKGLFIPKGIRNLSVDSVRGIYVPYWVVNCDFHDTVLVKAYVKSGKSSRATYFGRSGTSSFINLPLDASLRLNDNMAKRLEPFFFDDMKDFDEDYLDGFYADTSDMSTVDLRAAVLKRCDEMFSQEIISTVRAKDPTVERSCPTVNIHEDAVYVMLPVWFYTFMYNGDPHTVIVNGQTGKTVGAMPYDKRMIIGLGISLFLLILALFVLPLLSMNTTESILYGIAFAPYILSGMVAAGSLALTHGIRKYKKLKRNIMDTQSSSTFLYARKRQA